MFLNIFIIELDKIYRNDCSLLHIYIHVNVMI